MSKITTIGNEKMSRKNYNRIKTIKLISFAIILFTILYSLVFSINALNQKIYHEKTVIYTGHVTDLEIRSGIAVITIDNQIIACYIRYIPISELNFVDTNIYELVITESGYLIEINNITDGV